MVCDVPGGIAVTSAAFDVIVDVGAARVPTLPRAIRHIRATSRDPMLVKLNLDNREGMVAPCGFTKPDAGASQIIAVSDTILGSFGMSASAGDRTGALNRSPQRCSPLI